MALDLRMLADYQASLRSGQKARASRIADKLIADNLGLVRRAVNRWKPFLGQSRSTDYEDLLQAGMLGLLDAIRGFNPAVGAFSTYATFKILHQIQCVVRKDRLIWWPKNQGKAPVEFTSELSDQTDAIGIAAQEYREDLVPVLARLPEPQRSLVSRVLEGKPAGAVAKEYKVKVDVVLSAIQEFGALWEQYDRYPELH